MNSGGIILVIQYYYTIFAILANVNQLTNCQQVKHSVKANALYSAIDHPRFGVIPTIISLRPIKKGEEILTDYNYKGELVNTKVGLGWDSDVKEEKTKDEL